MKIISDSRTDVCASETEMFERGHSDHFSDDQHLGGFQLSMNSPSA